MSESEAAFRRVDHLLIEPLRDAGLRKQRRMTAEGLEEMLGQLRRKLSYLSDASLEALREIVERHAGGAARNLWPDQVSILNWARALQEPPEGESRLVVNFMACEAARRFYEEAGIEGAIALRKFLIRQHRAPCSYGWTLIRQQAEEWRRRRSILRERGGALSEADQTWLAGFEAAGTECRALMFPEGRA